MVTISQLVWDAWNVTHIARHAVTPEEVEAVCHRDPLVQQAKQGRLAIIGPTATGRMLTVIVAEEQAGVYYPVTARPASRKERALYRLEIGGEAQ